MCFVVRDEQMIAIIQRALNHPQFETWNMTSFHHMVVAVEGYNGEEAHYLALQLLEECYAWAIQQPQVRFGFPDKHMIRNLIDTATEVYKEKRHTLSTEREQHTSMD
jgi:hypothetical protein